MELLKNFIPRNEIEELLKMNLIKSSFFKNTPEKAPLGSILYLPELIKYINKTIT